MVSRGSPSLPGCPLLDCRHPSWFTKRCSCCWETYTTTITPREYRKWRAPSKGFRSRQVCRVFSTHAEGAQECVWWGHCGGFRASCYEKVKEVCYFVINFREKIIWERTVKRIKKKNTEQQLWIYVCACIRNKKQQVISNEPKAKQPKVMEVGESLLECRYEDDLGHGSWNCRHYEEVNPSKGTVVAIVGKRNYEDSQQVFWRDFETIIMFTVVNKASTTWEKHSINIHVYAEDKYIRSNE